MKCIVILFSLLSTSVMANDFFALVPSTSQKDITCIPQVKNEQDKQLASALYLGTIEAQKYLEEENNKQKVYNFIVLKFTHNTLSVDYPEVYKKILGSIIKLSYFYPHAGIFYDLHDYAFKINDKIRKFMMKW